MEFNGFMEKTSKVLKEAQRISMVEVWDGIPTMRPITATINQAERQ